MKIKSSVRKMMGSFHAPSNGSFHGSFHRSRGHVELGSDSEDGDDDSSDSECSFAFLFETEEEEVQIESKPADMTDKEEHNNDIKETEVNSDDSSGPVSPKSPTSVLDVMDASSIGASASPSFCTTATRSPYDTSPNISPNSAADAGRNLVLRKAKSIGSLLIDDDEEENEPFTRQKRTKKGSPANSTKQGAVSRSPSTLSRKKDRSLRKSKSSSGLLCMDVDSDATALCEQETCENQVVSQPSPLSGAQKKEGTMRKSKSLRNVTNEQKKYLSNQCERNEDEKPPSSRRRKSDGMKKSKSWKGLRRVESAAGDLSSTEPKSKSIFSQRREKPASKSSSSSGRSKDSRIRKAKSTRDLGAVNVGPDASPAPLTGDDDDSKPGRRKCPFKGLSRSSSLTAPPQKSSEQIRMFRRGNSLDEGNTIVDSPRNSRSYGITKSKSVTGLRNMEGTEADDPPDNIEGARTWKSKSMRNLGPADVSTEEKVSSESAIERNAAPKFTPQDHQATPEPGSSSSREQGRYATRKCKPVRISHVAEGLSAPSSVPKRRSLGQEDEGSQDIRRRSHSTSRRDKKKSTSTSSHTRRSKNSANGSVYKKKHKSKSFDSGNESPVSALARREKGSASNSVIDGETSVRKRRSKSRKAHKEGKPQRTRSRRTLESDKDVATTNGIALSNNSSPALSIATVASLGRSPPPGSEDQEKERPSQGSKEKSEQRKAVQPARRRWDSLAARVAEDEGNKEDTASWLRRSSTEPDVRGLQNPVIVVRQRGRPNNKSPNNNSGGHACSKQPSRSLKGLKDVRSRLGQSLHSSQMMLSPKGCNQSIASYSHSGTSVSSLTMSSRLFTQDDISISSSQRSPFRRAFSSPRLCADASIEEDDETSHHDLEDHPMSSRWESLPQRKTSADSLPVAPDHDLSTVGGASEIRRLSRISSDARWSTDTKTGSSSMRKKLEADSIPIRPNHDTSSYCGSVPQAWQDSDVHVPDTPSYSIQSAAGLISELTPGTYMADGSRASRDSGYRNPTERKSQRDDESGNFGSLMSSLSTLLLHTDNAAGISGRQDGAPKMVRRHSFDSVSHGSFSGNDHDSTRQRNMLSGLSESDNAPKMPARRTSTGSSVYYALSDSQGILSQGSATIAEEE